MSQRYEIVDGVYVGPKEYDGNMRLVGRGVVSLGGLEIVRRGWLDLTDEVGFTDLGNLREVHGDMYLAGTSISSLGNVQFIAGELTLNRTARLSTLGGLLEALSIHMDGSGIQCLGKLESSSALYLSREHYYSYDELASILSTLEKARVADLSQYLYDPRYSHAIFQKVIMKTINQNTQQKEVP